MLATTLSNSTRIVTSYIQYAADLNPKPNRNNPNNLLEANILTGYNVRLGCPSEFIIILLKIAHKAAGGAHMQLIKAVLPTSAKGMTGSY